ncbi:tetratricopeptide repeat protein [Neorhodopirellula pilleata]|uniref:tetratricopeptide repeat protein n=1 Tax=Neorhodopirellula pilleata TaxID=2714738 RepID=UPI001E57EABE|nr:tetratricopeptide repeat protein [Neorhodopirellula pilleata]
MIPIRVSASPGKIMDGPRVIEEVASGTPLWAEERGKNGWWLVTAPVAKKQGWIHVSDIVFPQYSARQREQLQLADQLHSQHFALKKSKDFDGAITKLKQAIAATESLFDVDHPEVNDYRESLALCMNAIGDTQEAIDIIARVRTSWEKTLGTQHPYVLRALFNPAFWLKRVGRNAEAEAMLKESFTRRNTHYGPHHKKTLDALSSLADITTWHSGDMAQAREYYQLLVDGYTKTLDEFDVDRVEATMDLADATLRLGRFDEGRKLYDDTLEKLIERYGEKHENVLSAMASYALGLSNAPLGNGPITLSSTWSFEAGSGYEELLLKARSLRREIVKVRVETLGPDHAKTLEAQSLLADNLSSSLHNSVIDKDALRESVQLRRLMLAKKRELFGDEHKETTESVDALIKALDQSELYEEAMQHRRYRYERALELHGPKATETLVTGVEVVRGMVLNGKTPEARQECDRILDLCLQDPLNNYRAVYAIDEVLSDLGDAGAILDLWDTYYRELRQREVLETYIGMRTAQKVAAVEMSHGFIDRAKSIIADLIPVYQKQLSDDSQWDNFTRHWRATQIAVICSQVGLDDASLRFHQIAFDLGMNRGSASGVEYLNLGVTFSDAGRPHEARPLLARALELSSLDDNSSNQVLPTCISAYASVLLELGDHDTIKQLTIQLAEVFAKALEVKDPGVLRQIHYAGQSLARAGQHEEVLEILNRSVPLLLELLPETHVYSQHSREVYSEVLLRAGKPLDAFQVIDQSRVASRAFIASSLPLITPNEQFQFLTTKDQAKLEKALSLAVHLKNQSEVAEKSAGWLLNSKALTQETVGKTTLTSDPRVTKLVRELRDVNGELAALTYQPASEQSAIRLSALKSQQRSLHRRLSTAGLNLSVSDQWVKLDLNQAKLDLRFI